MDFFFFFALFLVTPKVGFFILFFCLLTGLLPLSSADAPPPSLRRLIKKGKKVLGQTRTFGSRGVGPFGFVDRGGMFIA